MKLFEMKNWQLIVSEETWGLLPFQKLLKRDKTKDKTVANAEVLFVWYWCDVKSDYKIMKEPDRLEELKKDISGLPAKWVKDKVIEECIALYVKHETVIQKLHRQALSSADAVGDYLENTAELLAERDQRGMPIIKIADITRGLKDVKVIIKELKITENEVIKEQVSNDEKKKGSKSFNMFEEGLGDGR